MQMRTECKNVNFLIYEYYEYHVLACVYLLIFGKKRYNVCIIITWMIANTLFYLKKNRNERLNFR